METIQSCVLSVVKRVERSGYTALKFKYNGEIFTLVGFLGTMPRAGERFAAEGQWIDSVRYGHQFHATKLESIAPASEEELITFLSSGLFPGIGLGTAKKIVAIFGESVLGILDEKPELLLTITGIGRSKLAEIVAAWKEHHGLRDVARFLAPHGFSLSLAGKVWREWGSASILNIEADPYSMYHKFSGASFRLVDRLAVEVMKQPKDSFSRIKAAISESMSESYGAGHSCLPEKDLLARAQLLLGFKSPKFMECLEDMIKLSELFRETPGEATLIYTPSLRRAEIDIAAAISSLTFYRPLLGEFACEDMINELCRRSRLTISSSQRSALLTIYSNPVSIMTGGPGTGKTRLTELVCRAGEIANIPIHLGAPTGRAAKRLSESTRLPAHTLHRLLCYNPAFEKFQRNRESPLPKGLVLVDEASMLDVSMASCLLRAVEDGSQLVFVGDVDQLPAVGPGNFLKNLIESRPESTARLTEIHRQSQGSQIVYNAHRLLKGEGMDFPSRDTINDFCLVRATNTADMFRMLEKSIMRLIERGFHPLNDIQVLVPGKKGEIGCRAINRFLQDLLNPLDEHGPTSHGLRVHDKVVQVTNDYDRDVFNGNLGRVEAIDMDLRTATISFDRQLHEYAFNELDAVELAYAMTVHKSQGSEYPVVICLIHPQYGPLLTRRLLYTAITRARKFLVLVGDEEAIHTAAQNNSEAFRYTGLLERLQKSQPPEPVAAVSPSEDDGVFF